MAGISRRPTLSEVAARAGVGTTTVSRVINGGQRVDPKTLARVQKAIDALGYTPNLAARILKGHRTRTIGLLIPSLADPFFANCAEAAQSVARSNESLLIVTTTQNDPQAELEGLSVLIAHRVDGVIVAPADAGSGQLRRALERSGVPVVALDRPLKGSSIPYVVADNYAGAGLATQHLIEHGYHRIVCMTGEPELYTIRERIRGYRDAVRRARLPELLMITAGEYQPVEDAVRDLLDAAQPPEAIFTLKNSTTRYAYEALQKLRAEVPRRVALLGYDDFELADTVRPSITVIQQPVGEIGRAAAELLFEELPEGERNDRIGRRRGVHLGTRLVRRSTCGCG